MAESGFSIVTETAFTRALPQLLKQHAGEWVAYHGEQMIGVAHTKSEMHQVCFWLGLGNDEFEVRCIEQPPEEFTFGPREWL